MPGLMSIQEIALVSIECVTTLNQTTMSIQKELDHVREQKFAKDMQYLYDKLNVFCLQLGDMRLEDFAPMIEKYNLNLDDDDQDKWINQPPPWHYNEDFR